MSAPGSVRDFYDQLATDYHLIYEDWRAAVRRQGAILDRWIRSIMGPGSQKILDCACGIGTQAIGLALRGHQVTATDISATSVERARKEAADAGVDIAFGSADFRMLERDVTGPFDVVVACDNSLPHLTTDEELSQAARSIHGMLRPGGLLIASTRDYEEALRAGTTGTPPRMFDDERGRRVVFQTWAWQPDGRTYTVHLFILRGDDGGWDVNEYQTTYRAVLPAELSQILSEAGFGQVTWQRPADSGFYQPLVTARAD
jgi:SAM-dependent methyltransferase